MEHVPQPEAIAEEQPDLYEVFADQKVTVFGITKTFSELMDMCPLDPSDPRFTIESKNEYVVKFANEGGLAIDPKYEQLFVDTLERVEANEKVTFERKFTVAEPKPDALDRPKEVVLKLVTAEFEPSQRERALVAQLSARVALESAISSQPTTSNEQTIKQQLDEDSVLNTKVAKVIKLNPSVATQELTSETGEMSARIITFPKQKQVLKAEPVAALPESVPVPINSKVYKRPELPLAINIAVESNVVGGTETKTEVAEVVDLESRRPAEEPKLAFEDISQMVELHLEVILLNELKKEPAELYEDVTATLGQMLLEATMIPEVGSVEADSEAALDLLSPEATMILTSLLEDLEECDDTEKTEATKAMVNIVGMLHGLAVLEADGEVTPGEVAMIREQLVEYCRELFELAGLEPSDEELELFTQVICVSKFTRQLGRKPELMQLVDMGAEDSDDGIKSTKRHGLFMLLHLPVGRLAVPPALAA